ncbi:MAG: hypothetical protein HYZ69_03080 [Candidatus Colwellbacteria bacterium]|nr:hypothetical protein [Candidatus Colwellbacteria bacterium]
MRQSQLFGKTLREAPKDEVASNAQLLERSGFVHKTAAGVYDFLPLGFRVLDKINSILRQEMNAIGGQELFLSAFQPKERWEKTGRWATLGDIMYRFKDHAGREFGLAATHEEALSEIAKKSIQSYKDLPLFVYQIQTKFRDEPRAKSGLIRGREFLMKDLYSFHRDEKDLERFYAIVDAAYKKIFKRCGLHAIKTEAAGGTFTSDFTHEYQVQSSAGEDWIFYCPKGHRAQNQEIASVRAGEKCGKCGACIERARSIEVGNIFKLGTKFSEAFELLYADETGNKHPVVMGCYGIGPGRLMATIVETHHDEKGILWPFEVAPFGVHILELPARNGIIGRVKKEAERMYMQCAANGLEALYDDRDDKTAGEKFADADLIGIPWRAVISEKTIEKKGIEIKKRSETGIKIVSEKELFKKLLKN